MQYRQHRKPDGQGNKLLLSRFMLQAIKELTGFRKNEQNILKIENFA